MRRTYQIAEALGALVPDGKWLVRDNDWDQVEWFDDSIAKPTLEQINAKIVELEADEPMRVLKEIRDWHLQGCDWTQATDLRTIRGSEWCAAWDTYRQQLRDLPDNVSGIAFDENNFLINVTWPTKPNLT